LVVLTNKRNDARSTVLNFAQGPPDRDHTSPVRAQHNPVGSPRYAIKTSRSNPQSQSFSQSYGSILPTSLIYIVLSTRGCSPWRPDAVMSTTKCVNKSRPRIFKGRRERTGQTKGRFALPPLHPYRRVNRFQGQKQSVKKKRQLFPGYSLASPSLFVLPHNIHFLVREY
jgi:hypothetical protein